MKYFISFLVAAILASSLPANAQQTTETLTITSGESVHSFAVELADEPEEIRFGLMERTELAPNAGMLFDFGEVRTTNMWMQNTLISLDMLFLAPDGTIVAIARNTVPLSERQINPGVPVKGVLEIVGGRAAELGIAPGDTLEHPLFAADLG